MKERNIFKHFIAMLMSGMMLLIMSAVTVLAGEESQSGGGAQMTTFMIIIVVLVILIVALVLFFMFRMKKMSEEIKAQSAVRQQPVFTPPQGAAPVEGTTVLNGAGMEGTTVLNPGAGMEGTTVLNPGMNGMGDQYSDNYGTSVLGYSVDDNQSNFAGGSLGELFRIKTGAKVTINKDNFKIGRQRDSVDYCIDDNNAVGRVHAVILRKNGAVYIKDNRSTNGTFVNNVRVRPNGESLIATGDRVTIADEAFTFTAY